MTIHIEYCWYFSLQLLGLVENGGRLEAGNDLVAKLSHAVALAGLHNTEILKPGGRLNPFAWPTMKHNVAQEVLTQFCRFGFPALKRGRRRRLGNPAQDIFFELKKRNIWSQNFVF